MSKLIARRDAELNRANEVWSEVLAFVDSLTAESRDSVRSVDGWSAKDHIVHLGVWKSSFVLWLDDISGHEAVGVSKELFDSENLELINTEILEVHRHQPWESVRSNAIASHRQWIEAIYAQSEDRLLAPMGKVSLIDALPDLTWEHDRDHLIWLKQTLAQPAEISR